MTTKKITGEIYYFGAQDNDLKLFESLWKIPDGISYNCYLINDEKTALIDTVEKRFNQELLENIKTILKDKHLDYLVINHMEPDHSGTIKEIQATYPKVTIVGNHKTAGFAQGFYDIPENQIKEVKTGDSLQLGKHQLKFHQTPMLHWPESMVSYEEKTKTLFSSDLFGGFKTVGDEPFADDHNDLTEYIDQARQYFATVLGAYTRPAKKTLNMLSNLEIDCVAPAHGLMWQKNSKKIIDLYQQWSELKGKPGVVIIVGSMYGFTREMAQLIKNQLETKKIPAKTMNAAQTTLGEQLAEVWQSQGVIIGSCTYNNGLFPPIKYLINALKERKIQNRYLGIFGSYSWTGGAMRFLEEFAGNSKLNLVEPQFETQYKLDEQSKKEAIKLAENMANKINSSN